MKSDPAKIKTLLTVLLLLSGTGLTFLFVSNTQSAFAYQSTGIAIDFGNRDVEWADVDFKEYTSPIEVLEYACDEIGYELVIEDNVVIGINGIYNDDERIWAIWVVEKGKLDWVKLTDIDTENTEEDTEEKSLSRFSASSWAYCSEDEVPTVGVDQFGRSIHGYPQAQRIVTLSPAITEIVGSLNAANTIVGTDSYSNYPEAVVEGKNNKSITNIGDFINPSFELIMKTQPDLVLCDGSQYAHYEMAERIRKTTVNSIVLYAGESIDTIIDNIYIVGMVMGYEMRSEIVIKLLEMAEGEILDNIGKNLTRSKSTIISLSADKAPWVSGPQTYADDILNEVHSENVFTIGHGWIQTNSELIVQANPEVAIILTRDYSATESEYEIMLNNMSAEWKQTDAYKNKQIYLLGEEAGEMAQRSGPRYAQFMELMTLILYDDVLSSDDPLPKYIGDNYRDFLTFTEYLGFE